MRWACVLLLAACGGQSSGGLPTTDGGTSDLASNDLAGVDASGNPPAADLGAGDASLASSCGTGTLLSTLACDGTTATAPSSAMRTAVQGASRGDVVTIDDGEGSTPCLPSLVCTNAGAATLLFSDEPESPTSDGILYAATVSAGNFRAYVYHTNGAASGQRKMTVVALNQGASDATITFGHVGSAGPSTDYVATGAAAAAAWLSSSPGGTLTVPAGTRVVVDSTLDGRHASPNELVVGQVDFTTSAALKISVVTVDAAADAATSTATLSLLPNDGKHVRGTFAGADLTFVPTGWPRDGVRHLRLGSGDSEGEPLLTGVDQADGNTAVTLAGNYGVHYSIGVPAGSVGMGLSPRGGAWGGAASLPPGDDATQGGVLTLPSNDSTTTMISVGRFTNGATLELFSAGGSNLPVDLVAVPLP